MNSAKIWLGDYAMHEHGEPQYGWRTEFAADANGAPRTQRTTYSLDLHFFESSFADNEARIAILRTLLNAGELVLRIVDEGGVELVREVVTIRDTDCPKEWRQYTSAVSLTLQGTSIAVASAVSATYTPAGGLPIALPNVTDWKENIETERGSDERANRVQTTVNISASGFVLADKSLSLPARRASMLALQAQMRGVHSKDGQLVFVGTDQTVKVRVLDADIADGSDRLEWSLQCFFRTYPQGDYCEARFSASSREDSQSGELVVSVRGDVRAANRDLATTKVAAIRQSYAQTGSFLRVNEVSDDLLSGGDGDTWVQLSFSFEFRSSLDSLVWDLRVSTRSDARTSDDTITYEGSVRGKTASEALAQARSLGLGKQPFQVSSSEQFATRGKEIETDQFIELSFSYEYIAKNEYLSAEITSRTSHNPFGEHRFIVSGNVTAATEALARAFANTLRPTGLIRRENEDSTSARTIKLSAEAAQFIRYDFSDTYYLTPATSSAEYTREEVSDYESLERTVTFSGTAYGPSESECLAFINVLTAKPSAGLRRRKSSRSPSYEAQSTSAHLVSVSFQEEFSGTLTAVAGQQIIQAAYSVRTVFSINRSVLTTIPFGTPYAQTQCGLTIGTRTVRGSVLAVTEGAGRTWARAKRSLISGGHEEPAEEESGFEFAPFESDTPKFCRFEFSYGARFVSLTF